MGQHHVLGFAFLQLILVLAAGPVELTAGVETIRIIIAQPIQATLLFPIIFRPTASAMLATMGTVAGATHGNSSLSGRRPSPLPTGQA